MEKPTTEVQNPTTEVQNPTKEHHKRKPRTENKEGKPANQEENGNVKPKKEREPRNNDWKIELEKTMTVETKIPPLPKESALLKKPDQNLFNLNLDKIAKKIEKTHQQIEELKKQEQDLRDEIYAKNNSEFVELKKFSDQRREIVNKMTNNKKDKKVFDDKITELEEKIAKTKKKGMDGKLLSKDALESIISEKERDYKNRLKTATEEKKFLEEISQLKSMMPLSDEISKIRNELDKVYAHRKEISEANKKLGEEVEKVNKAADVIRTKLNLPEKKEETPAEKKDKPKRELTNEEKDMQAKRNAFFDQIGKLKDQRTVLKDKHHQDYDNFNKQQDEVYRINFMMRQMKKLKYEENRKKWDAEKDKRKEEDMEKIRMAVASKFNEDIEMCDYLIGQMEQLKLRETMDAGRDIINKQVEYKVDDKHLKEENLVFMKPKKNDDEGIQPGQKKFAKKGMKKGGDQNKKTEESKFSVDFGTVQSLGKVGVAIPVSVEQLDKTISELQEKKEEFTKKREEAVALAQTKVEDLSEEKPKDELEEKVPEKKEEKAKPAKEIKFDDNLFPTLV